jgi:hypothetical protein
MLDLVKFMNPRWETVVVLRNKARWRSLAVCQGWSRKQIRARAAYMRKHGLNRHDRVIQQVPHLDLSKVTCRPISCYVA